MRTVLTILLLLGCSAAADAQRRAPIAGPEPALPSIGLPLPTIGLPLPSIGLPPPPPQPRPAAGRPFHRPPPGYRNSRVYPAPVYVIPTYVPTYAVPGVPEPPAEELEAVAGGRLRVDVGVGIPGQVYLDGYYVGSTDDLSHAMDVASGRHAIEIRAEGYQSIEDAVAIAPGRSVTYRGTLGRLPSEVQAPAPPAAGAAQAPVPSAGPTTFYVIPGCYIGNVPPQDTTLPAGCDPERAVTIKR